MNEQELTHIETIQTLIKDIKDIRHRIFKLGELKTADGVIITLTADPKLTRYWENGYGSSTTPDYKDTLTKDDLLKHITPLLAWERTKLAHRRQELKVALGCYSAEFPKLCEEE